jgi:hypothetical protein
VQKSIKKSAVCVLLFLAFQQIASPKDANTGRRLSAVERAVIFSIQREIEASNLPVKRDLCIGFDQRLALDEKAIISSLKRKGMHVHADEWCIQGPRGFRVGIIAPINNPSRNVRNKRTSRGSVDSTRGALCYPVETGNICHSLREGIRASASFV